MLKIILKIFVKISSRRRSIIKSFPKARYSSAFWLGIFVKDFVCCLPELQIISCEAPPPKKNPFPKTVNCYLLSVPLKNHFWKLSTVNCNACNTKKIVFGNCYLLFVICTAKKSFSETVILLYCNAWGWCH